MPNPNIEPSGLSHPNFYCRSYNFNIYILCLLFSFAQRSVRRPAKYVPDPKGPKFRYKSCNCKCLNLDEFRVHLLYRTHKVNILLLRTRFKPTTDSDPKDSSFYCKSCNVAFSCIDLFLQQLRGIHKLSLSLLREKECLTIQPDPNDANDLNSFCKPCNIQTQMHGKYKMGPRFLKHS